MNKKRKRKRFKIIKVSVKVHNKFANTLKNLTSSRPVYYLLGQNKKKIIDNIIPLQRKGSHHLGCQEMVELDDELLAKAVVKLIKKRRNPCGMVRIGTSFYSRGTSGTAYEIMRVNLQKGFLLTYGSEQIKIESYNPKIYGKINRNYQYKVI